MLGGSALGEEAGVPDGSGLGEDVGCALSSSVAAAPVGPDVAEISVAGARVGDASGVVPAAGLVGTRTTAVARGESSGVDPVVGDAGDGVPQAARSHKRATRATGRHSPDRDLAVKAARPPRSSTPAQRQESGSSATVASLQEAGPVFSLASQAKGNTPAATNVRRAGLPRPWPAHSRVYYSHRRKANTARRPQRQGGCTGCSGLPTTRLVAEGARLRSTYSARAFADNRLLLAAEVDDIPLVAVAGDPVRYAQAGCLVDHRRRHKGCDQLVDVAPGEGV